MRPRFEWIGTLALALVAVRARGQTLQVWPEIDLNFKADHWSLLVPSSTRLDVEGNNPRFIATGIVATQEFSPHWSLSCGYLFAALPPNDTVAHVPLLAVTVAGQGGPWRISEINRIEKLVAYKDEPFRYRNRIGAVRVFDHGRRRVGLADEFFFNLTFGSWNQNRAQVSFGTRLRPSLWVDGYYLQRSAPGGSQGAVLGAALAFTLHKRQAP